jgi:hypothetical protein
VYYLVQGSILPQTLHKAISNQLGFMNY